jgi:hypothetical protein
MKFLLLFLTLIASAFSQTSVTLLAHQKLVVANNGGQTITDVGPLYTGQAKFFLTAKSDAGTSPTLAVKLQSSPPLNRFFDVASTSSDTVADIKHRSGAAENLKIAAKFVVPTGGLTISKVYLPLKKAGAPTGTFTLAVYADTAGDPSGSALATFGTLNVATLTTSYAQTAFSLTTPVDLAAGTFHLVATSDVSASASVNVLWRSITVASGGNLNLYGSAWVPTATSNMEFQAFFYQFADITGGGFASVAAVASTQAIELNIDKFSLIRPYITIGGTDSPAFYLSVSALAKQVQP